MKQSKSETTIGFATDHLSENRRRVVVPNDEKVTDARIDRDPGMTQVRVNNARFVFLVVVYP